MQIKSDIQRPLNEEMNFVSNKMDSKLDTEEFHVILNDKNRKLQSEFENSIASMGTAMGKINEKVKKKEEESKSIIKSLKKEQSRMEAKVSECVMQLSDLEIEMKDAQLQFKRF